MNNPNTPQQPAPKKSFWRKTVDRLLREDEKTEEMKEVLRQAEAQGGVDLKQIDDRLKVIFGRTGDTVADISFYYLPYIKHILTSHPNTKVVCLQRNKNDTVNSYMTKTSGRNHWCNDGGSRADPIWDKTYPHYDDIKNKKDAIKRYWEEYYETMNGLVSLYPDNVHVYDFINVLNDKQTQTHMFNFIGLSDFNITLNIKKNRTKV